MNSEIKQWICNDTDEIDKFINLVSKCVRIIRYMKDKNELYDLLGYISVDGILLGSEHVENETLHQKHILFKNEDIFIEYRPNGILYVECEKDIQNIHVTGFKINASKYISIQHIKDILSSHSKHSNIFEE